MTNQAKLVTLETVQIVAAAALFLAPWALGFSGNEAAAWSAWLTAGAVMLFASLISVDVADWSGWGTLVSGLWAMVAPALLGFLTNLEAAWSHIVTGGVTSLSAIAVLAISMNSLSGGPGGDMRSAAT